MKHKRVLSVLLLVLGLGVTSGAVDARAEVSGSIVGAGSTLAEVAFDTWAATATRLEPPLDVGDYRGDGNGIDFAMQQFAAGQIDFIGTDVRLPAEPLAAAGRSVAYVPVVASGVAVAFNVSGASGQRIVSLKADGPLLCRVLLERGMPWADPELVAANPQLTGAAGQIRRMYHGARTGASDAVASFCKAEAPDVWAAAGIAESDGLWARQVGVPFNGSNEAAHAVLHQPGSVSFLPTAYAIQIALPVMAIETDSGLLAMPSEYRVQAALAASAMDDAGFVSVDPTSTPDGAYPLTFVAHAAAPLDHIDPDRGSVLARFLAFSVTTGQRWAGPLAHAALPPALRHVAADRIRLIPGGAAAADAMDLVAPTVTAQLSRPPDGIDGWYRQPVTIDWRVDDPLPSSGVGATPSSVIAGIEGSEIAYSSEWPTCDNAFNCVTATAHVSIDATPPTLTIGGPQPGATYVVGAAPTPSCAAEDALSGLRSACTIETTGLNSRGVGTAEVGATAIDRAGNTATATTTFQVVYHLDGRHGPLDRPLTTLARDRPLLVRLVLRDAAGRVIAPESAPTWRLDPLDDLGAPPHAGMFSPHGKRWAFSWLPPRRTIANLWRLTVTLDDGTVHITEIRLTPKHRPRS